MKNSILRQAQDCTEQSRSTKLSPQSGIPQAGQSKIKSGAGFTLIELIIVFTILGALASIFTLNFPSAQRRARDTQRRGDIKQYQTSLEVYANKTTANVYPTGSGALAGYCATLGLSACPDDPKAPPSYQYQSGASDTRYVVWAQLEQPDEGGNTQYFVSCSTGESGDTSVGIPPASGNCPI